MNSDHPLAGILIDEAALTLEELACACAVEPAWVVERVQAGLFGNCAQLAASQWRFASAELVRARRLAALERDFEANRSSRRSSLT
jgi:chaperone modulatory protein CbpM